MPEAVPTFEQRLAEAARLAEETLDALLSGPTGARRPARLLAAMRHATLGGGKRLRPFLVFETAAMFGCSPARAAQAAAALELVHVYSLVHDDLPAMDDDDMRRGKPTVHRAFDEATAILVGDALQTLAFEVLADPATHPDPGVRIGLVSALARGAGLDGMAGGQMLDLAAEGRGQPVAPVLGADDVRLLQAMKTGALFSAAVDFGALIGGANAAERAYLEAYARHFGAAFQIADDILDLEASAADLGKATGKDDARGKATLPNVIGLSAAKAERDARVVEAVAALAAFGTRAEVLAAAARFAAARRS